MKNTFFLILIFAFLTTAKTNAQTSNEEAVATYQMAQEKFDQGQYKDALTFLDKVDELNSSAKTKTSHLKAKCYFKIINQNNYKKESQRNNCINCLNNSSFADKI